MCVCRQFYGFSATLLKTPASWMKTGPVKVRCSVWYRASCVTCGPAKGNGRISSHRRSAACFSKHRIARLIHPKISHPSKRERDIRKKGVFVIEDRLYCTLYRSPFAPEILLPSPIILADGVCWQPTGQTACLPSSKRAMNEKRPLTWTQRDWLAPLFNSDRSGWCSKRKTRSCEGAVKL